MADKTNLDLLQNHGLQVIAAASGLLTASKEADKATEGVVLLIAIARVIESDMRQLFANGQPDKTLMLLIENEVRVEIERIFTDTWARH